MADVVVVGETGKLELVGGGQHVVGEFRRFGHDPQSVGIRQGDQRVAAGHNEGL